MHKAPQIPHRRRFWVRLVVLVLAVVFALQVAPIPRLASILPGLSPLLSLLPAAAARRLTLFSLLGVPLIVLSLLKGPWFCGRVCPMGFAAETIGRRVRGREHLYLSFPFVGRWLVLLMAGSAAAGYPLFLWLDPLSLFNGFFSVWRRPLMWASLLPALGLVLVLVSNLLWPRAWCRRLCPLGATQAMLGGLGRILRRRRDGRADTAPEHPSLGGLSERRAFLLTLAGVGIGWGMRRWGAREPALPIRPPGAAREDSFRALCARCGNCIRACPYKILKPDLGQSGWSGLVTPVVDLTSAHCNEWCHECTRVCPTGAIRKLSIEEKRDTAIGLAEVIKSRCIAWENQQYCMVCHEFCPYLAIQPVEHKGVNCPVVDPAMCRGCGACQRNCPALPDKAIIVKGIEQRKARALPVFG